MEALTNNLHGFLFEFAGLVIVITELSGLFIVSIAIVREVYNIIFKYKLNFLKANDDNRLDASLATALEILLAAEILKTIIVTDYRNLVIIAVLIVLRIAMTLLLVWETSHKAEHGPHSEERHLNE